jgi:Mg-chelatase subunit ChlD
VIAAFGFALVAPPAALAQLGGFRVQIRRPASDLVVPNEQTSIEVEGRASNFAGVEKLDLFLVMDTSNSLRKTDPNDHRSAGAIGLVKFLFWSNTYIGVVDFDRNAKLVSPLTGDRSAVKEAIRGLDREGKTDLAAGIRTALKGFEQAGRPGSSRVMLVFTDGKSKQKPARKAMAEAREQGVSISTLLLGSDDKGAAILREIADGTGGSFVAVTDPSRLPDAFLGLRTLGIERVDLRVNDSAPIPARLAGGIFSAEVPLGAGENRIVATATSSDGREREDTIAVTVRAPGCAELQVRAESNGKPALSISSRAVEIVVDASGSMWGRMDGRTKIEIAKQILDGALDWLPPDLNLSLRAYGHQHDPEEHNCEDTQLLVSPGSGNRAEIRSAIAGLRPKGQTPLGYALGQVSADFADFAGERAVVLVTDGIESCGGDAPSAARSLQDGGSVPVHVMGFGLTHKTDEDLASLRAIAEASGGRFLTAGSAAELHRALSTTVGTPYSVWRGDVPVARGTLGGDDRIQLPPGDYRVRLDSTPPHELPVSLASTENLSVLLRREGARVVHTSSRAPTEYTACGEAEADALLGQQERVPAGGLEAFGDAVPAAPAASPTQAQTPASPAPATEPSP